MKRIAVAVASSAMALTGSALMASPAHAAGPVITGGLVNVTITDLIDGGVVNIDDIGVGVAANILANVCPDVTVGGILGELRDTGNATCTARSGDQEFSIVQ